MGLYLRFFAVLLPGLLSLFLIARAFVDGNRSDLRYAAVIALLIAASSLIRLPVTAHGRFASLQLFGLWIASLLLLPFTVIVLIFGHVDMAGFVFHLIAGLGGTPWADMMPFIVTSVALHASVLVSLHRLLPWLGKLRVVLPMLILGILLVNPLIKGVFAGNFLSHFSNRPSLAGHLMPVRTKRPATRPNLVILYLEGLERGFADVQRFGETGAPLRRLEAQGISFTEIEQIAATGWSLAGNVATQCGVPLLPPSAIGVYDGLDRIVPGVRCLPEILETEGYSLSYVTGANITGTEERGHYGYGAYLSRAPALAIFDEPKIRESEPDLRASPGTSWGLNDADVLAFAARLLERKGQSDQPYAVFVATMDTHGPVGVVSPDCTEDGQLFVSEKMEPAVACTSRLVEDFVAKVRKSQGDATRIVLMSDHLHHMSDVTDRLAQKPRSNTVIFIDSMQVGLKIDRRGAMIDVFPTLLDWLDLLPQGVTRAGLGTSLLSSEPTLLDRMGNDELSARINVDVALTAAIWDGDKE